MRKIVWGILNLLLACTVVVLALGSVVYHQSLLDWWRGRDYTPTAQVSAITDNIALTTRGTQLFFASRPSVESSEIFNQHCKNQDTESTVLGCYAGQLIYIYDVTDPQLNGVKEVTAAHELLHAAYERLGSQEKTRINSLLSAEMAKIKDERLQDQIKIYNKNEPGQLLNEMHSIIGTEHGDLTPELESYYAQYFQDRHKIVGYSDGYAAVFTASKQRMEQYDVRLTELKDSIDANTVRLERDKTTLDQEAAQLERARGSEASEFNSRVNAFNAKVAAFNSLAALTQNLVSEYNKIVVARNGEAAAQNTLYQSLSSKPRQQLETQ